MHGQADPMQSPFSDALRQAEDDPERAAAQARDVLDATPDHPFAMLLWAAAKLRGGAVAIAEPVFEQLAHRYPEDPLVWTELAEARSRLGAPEQALEAARRAIRLQPALSRAWMLLGHCRLRVGDDEGGHAACLEYIRLCDQDVSVTKIAREIVGRRLDSAESLLSSRLERCAGDVVATRMLAEIRLLQRRYDDAIALLEQALVVVPGFRAARLNLAVAHYRQGRNQDALDQLDALLAEVPDDHAIRDMRAAILSKTGDMHSAVSAYEDLLRKAPESPSTWLGYGHALKSRGRSDDAVRAYRKALSIQPEFGGAWWSLANLKTLRFSEADVEEMRSQLGRDRLDPESRLHVEFALAKALEDQSRYAEAFSHYALANAIRRRHLSYSAAQTDERNQLVRETYTEQFFGERTGHGCKAPDPIFILGMPRAGSTLVEQILASHPLIEGTAELPAVIAITQELRRQNGSDLLGGYHAVVAGLGEEPLTRLGEGYLARTRAQRRCGTPYFIDKMPNNFAHIGLIHLMLPSAKIVDVRRHPMACCFSNFKQNFARGQTFSYDLQDLGRYYRSYVELMAHFDEVLPNRIHRVIYEDLVSDTERVVRDLLCYCGVEFDARCLRHFENDRVVRTASSEQVRKPIFREGIDHWRHFESWLGPLKAALGNVEEVYPGVPDEFLDRAS